MDKAEEVVLTVLALVASMAKLGLWVAVSVLACSSFVWEQPLIVENAPTIGRAVTIALFVYMWATAIQGGVQELKKKHGNKEEDE